MVVEIVRSQGGKDQNKGLGFFINKEYILSVYHVYSYLDKHKSSSYYAIINGIRYRLNYFAEDCSKDLVLYKCEEFVCNTPSKLAQKQVVYNEIVNVNILKNNVLQNISAHVIKHVIHFNPGKKMHNYNCILNVYIFLVDNIKIKYGYSGARVVNKENKVVGIFSGKGKYDNDNKIYGLVIYLDEILCFLQSNMIKYNK